MRVLFCCFCLCFSLAFQAHAAGVAVHELPAMEGGIVKAARYTDATGDNLILLTETSEFVKKGMEHPREGQDKELFAYRLLLKKDGSVERVWRVMDYEYDCDLDMSVFFDPKAFRITDLDNNGQAEVWMTYFLGCQGDPGPMTMKIIMYEGDKKYAVRGESRAWVGPDTPHAGGGYTLDKAFSSGPTVFTTFAKELWEKYKNR